MKNPMVVLTVALVLSSIGRILARQWFVSPNGSDLPGCGNTSETPCSTLAHALQEVSDGDVIAVNASATKRNQISFCHEEPLLVAKSVTIRGVEGRVVIGCSLASVATQTNTTRNLKFNISGSAGSNFTRVSFLNLTFTSVFFEVFNSHVTFAECKVIDSRWRSLKTSSYIGLNMYNTEWQGSVDANCTSQSIPTGHLQIFAKTLYINYEDSKFYHTKQQITGDYCELYIRGSLFSNLESLPPVNGGIYLTIKDKQKNSVVWVYDSVFMHQIHCDPLQSIMNLYESALLVRAADAPPIKHLPPNVTVVVSNTKFLNNERGLTFIGPFVYVNVTSCEFEDNIAMHAGAGILYLTDVGTHSYVTNCTFLGNAGGAYRPNKVIGFKDILQIRGNKVWLNSTCCKGSVLMNGKGGAIRIQRGNVTFTECLFKNNTASLRGGSIFVDRQNYATMDNVSFANSPLLHRLVKGHFIYSYGYIIFKSISLSVFRAKNHIAMIYHSGDNWSMDVRHLYMQCPVGYQVRHSSAFLYGVTKFGLKQSYKVDELSYFCESCPPNEYSLESGYLKYKLNHTAHAYYTMRLDGTEPHQAFDGNNVYNIQCMPCPYGGKCEERIQALPNFWGYTEQSRRAVKFQHCPKGYCCSGDDCQGFSKCAPHRTGRLCGRCRHGYSETHSSPACVRDEKCSSLFLHMVSIGLGIIYMVYLLFQNDIEELLYNLRPTKTPHTQTYVREICSKFNTMLCRNRGNQERSNDHEVEEDMEIKTLTSKDKGDKPIHFAVATRYSTEEPPKDETTIDTTVLFYYLQDASLLQINTIFSSMESKLLTLLKTLIAILFNLDLDLVPGIDKICLVQGASPSIKLLFKAIIVPYVLLLFMVAWAVHRFVAKLCGIVSEKVSSRLATGAMLALLFSYQKLATTSFTLLNCVPVGEDAVLFIEGQIVCYKGWQYGVMAYTGVCIVPFCLVLLIGPRLLKDGLISLPQFFCACLLPLPFLLYWVTLRLRGQHMANRTEILSETQSVIKILQGPFKDTHNVLFGSTCGQGVLIGRRLILVLFFTFVNDPLMRMLYMMLVCFIILLHHVYVLPYKDVWGNLAGTASAVSLVIIAAINLVRAGFEAGEYVPEGPNSILARIMRIFEHLENILLLWFPAGVIVLLFFLLVGKAFIMLVNYLRKLNQSRA